MVKKDQEKQMLPGDLSIISKLNLIIYYLGLKKIKCLMMTMITLK